MKTNLASKLNSAFEQARKDLHTALLAGLSSLFEAHPNVKSLQFAAYTPYFNDGEECTYSCQAGDCNFNGYEEYEGSEIPTEGEDIVRNSQKKIYENGYNINEDYNQAAKDAVEAFRKELGEIEDEVWKMVVGDHVTVNITAEGITTKPYDHE